MGKPIDADDDDVDPNAPTRRVFSRSADRGGDDAQNRPTDDMRKARWSGGGDDNSDDDGYSPQTVRFRRKSAGGAEGAKPAHEAEVFPVGWLVIVKGPGTGHVLVLQEGMNILGRSPDAQVPIDFDDRGIAREDHVRFNYNRRSRRFHVVPGKGPETLFKGEPVLQPEEIATGDLIAFGDTVVRFVAFCDEGFDWSEAPVV